MKRNGRNAKRGHEAQRANSGASAEQAEAQPHRLRGGELADDFVDADADSCVVTHHRDEKESDS